MFDFVSIGILVRFHSVSDSDSTMFASTASSHSSSGNLGCPPVFGQGNEKGDEFVTKTFGSETMFGSPTGMSNYGRNHSTWEFAQTSTPLSSTTFGIGAPSYAGFGSSIPAFGFSSVHTLGSSSLTSVEGHSTSGNFTFPPTFMQGNQKEDSFASKMLCSTAVSSSHGTSSWAFNQMSSPFSTPTTFGATLSHGLLSFTSGGPPTTKSTFDVKGSHCVGEESGSRIVNYKRTADAASSAEKLVSISAMPVYKAKAHEELRWEDYKSAGKGGFGINPSGAKSISSSVTRIPTISWGTPSIYTTPLKPNPFGITFPSAETPTWKFPGPTSTSFTSQTLFCSSSANTPLTSSSATPLKSFNPFVPQTTNASSVSLAPLNRNPFTNAFTSLSTQMSSSTVSSPTFAEFTWGQDKKPSSLNDFWSTPINRPPDSTVAEVANSVSVLPVNYGLTSTFNKPTTLFKPCGSSTQNYNETMTGVTSQSPVDELSSSRITSAMQPSFVASPFGTLSPKPQMFLESSRSTQSTQYGISSIPVKDNPAPVRYPLPITRHLSRRSKLPLRKYDPKLNGPKMPFFSNTNEIPAALYVPGDNPRALVIGPETRRPRDMMENAYEELFSHIMYENERDNPTEEGVLAIVHDVPSKLQQPYYYTEPQISELEAKEMAEPGFCRHVKDFVVGRHGYGNIKFLGETDVRTLDLETIVQFNKREVIVYMDESKKPQVGEGLNKPAEITLVNVKCIDKKNGMQYTDGSKIIKYTEMLKKKAAAQGAEFISYDPVGGEWKFRVQHF